jgi:hypothetical protein
MTYPNLLILFAWIILSTIIVVIPFWRLTTRAGFAGWLSLLMLLPLANVGFLYFLAFAEWPVLEDKSQRANDQ